METWKIIKTHPNYSISNFGRVFNNEKKRFKATHPNKDGYMKVSLYPGSTVFFIHRLVALYFIENIDNKPIVNHIDSCRTNNFVSNLEWCTQKENSIHMVKQGKNPDYNGCKNPTANFIEEEILYIRNTTSKNDREMAEEFKVSRSSISNIRIGVRYKDVGGFIREKGTIPVLKGAANGNAKITEEIAKLIKYDTTGKTYKQIAKQYNTNSNIVSKIRRGKTWKHI
jgi:hypothetical protein